MAANLKVFLAFLVILIVFEQGCGCDLTPSDINIEQTSTGKTVQGQPEYKVTVTNPCPCPFVKVTLKCLGLNTVEPIDPDILYPLGDGTCLLIRGSYVHETPISFNYAQSTKYDFTLLDAILVC